MSDTLVTIIAIFIAAILMFVFPLMTLADRNDDISQLAVQTATDELVLEISKTGKFTQDEYETFYSKISTSESYDVQLEFQILDENLSKKTSQTVSTRIGENVYYSVYTTAILDQLNSSNKTYYLKEGDIVTVTVKNTSQTMSQVLSNVWYKVSGNDTYTIYGNSSAMVTVNGK